MKRAILIVLLVLLSGGFVSAGQYTLGENGYYFDAAGVAYTRSTVDNGYWAWNGCRWIWYPQTSYAYKAVKLDLAAPDFESQALAIVAARAKAQDRLALLDKLGLSSTGAGTGIVNPLAGYGSGVGKALQLGHYGASGNTIYGYSAYADPYGSTDLNTLYQQASALAKGSQDLTGQATGGFLDLVKQAGTNQGVVAQIREQGAAAERALNAAKAAPQGTATIVQGGQSGGQPGVPATAPNVMPRIGAVTTRAQIIRGALCASCHNGAGAKGGFDVSKWDTYTVAQKTHVLNLLTLDDDAKRMPRKADGSAGARPSMEQLKAFLEP